MYYDIESILKPSEVEACCGGRLAEWLKASDL